MTKHLPRSVLTQDGATATLSRAARNPRREMWLGPGKIGKALDQFLGAVTGEADGQLALFVFAVDADDGADAVGGMAHALADQRIGIAAAERARRNRRERAARAASCLPRAAPSRGERGGENSAAE